MSSIRWFVLIVVLWHIARALQSVGSPLFGSWPLTFMELLLVTVIPALFAFALIRLFLAVVQASYGSLNTYTLTANPWAWGFWLGLALALLGQGVHVTARVLARLLPEVVRNGEFATQITFMGTNIGYLLLGIGVALVSLVLLVSSPGPSYAVFGGERIFLFVASLITFGYAVVYIALVGGYYLPAIIGSAVLSIAGLWILSPYEVFRDPLGMLIVPGTALAGLTLIVWGVVVGGRPVWPF